MQITELPMDFHQRLTPAPMPACLAGPCAGGVPDWSDQVRSPQGVQVHSQPWPGLRLPPSSSAGVQVTTARLGIATTSGCNPAADLAHEPPESWVCQHRQGSYQQCQHMGPRASERSLCQQLQRTLAPLLSPRHRERRQHGARCPCRDWLHHVLHQGRSSQRGRSKLKSRCCHRVPFHCCFQHRSQQARQIAERAMMAQHWVPVNQARWRRGDQR
mmetsp:Transcript_80094/g.201509  ORF Transcript_80094/g.201509 Transcript_80094/m.201509 type:complete len:215 (-) Transcript_80094:520-1164(-)